jgi:hypothetical protein
MQCHELILIGILSEEREGKSKRERVNPIIYRVLIDSDKKEWHLPKANRIAEGINLKDFEGKKVKLTCMAIGKNNKLTDVKAIEKVEN